MNETCPKCMRCGRDGVFWCEDNNGRQTDKCRIRELEARVAQLQATIKRMWNSHRSPE